MKSKPVTVLPALTVPSALKTTLMFPENPETSLIKKNLRLIHHNFTRPISVSDTYCTVWAKLVSKAELRILWDWYTICDSSPFVDKFIEELFERRKLQIVLVSSNILTKVLWLSYFLFHSLNCNTRSLFEVNSRPVG